MNHHKACNIGALRMHAFHSDAQIEVLWSEVFLLTYLRVEECK